MQISNGFVSPEIYQSQKFVYFAFFIHLCDFDTDFSISTISMIKATQIFVDYCFEYVVFPDGKSFF